MRKRENRRLWAGVLWLALFAVWTWLVQTIDVHPAGETGTPVGFATVNCWFHTLTGVHMKLYAVTDWLGLVPVGVCLLFAGVGLAQLLQRKRLWKVDWDLLFLGCQYVLVVIGYLVFERSPINYRPILIGGYQEISYPSSTTLLVLSVMPTLILQANRRMKKENWKKVITFLTNSFSAFMVMGRLISGVHWLTDIVGSVFLSVGLFCLYQGLVLRYCNPKK